MGKDSILFCLVERIRGSRVQMDSGVCLLPAAHEAEQTLQILSADTEWIRLCHSLLCSDQQGIISRTPCWLQRNPFYHIYYTPVKLCKLDFRTSPGSFKGFMEDANFFTEAMYYISITFEGWLSTSHLRFQQTQRHMIQWCVCWVVCKSCLFNLIWKISYAYYFSILKII